MYPIRRSGASLPKPQSKLKSRRRKNAINRLKLEPLEHRVLLSGITVSIPSSMTTYQGGELAVPITVAQLTDGTGDTGLSSAGICINYNSSDFTVADVKQGTAGQEASSLLSVTTSGTAGALIVSIAEQTMEIASISAPGNGPVTVTAKEALPAGYSGSPFLAVQLSGIVGLSGANGVWNISVTGTKTFTLDNSNSVSGIAEADQGTFGAVMQGGVAGMSGGSNNPSIAVVDFLAKTTATTGSTPISLVASNSAGVAFFTAADGVGYNGTIASGSVNILASASAPKLGSFAAITPLSTLTGTANDPGIGVMLDLPNGDIMANGGDDGTSNEWFLLTPDAMGNYADGTWSALASSNIGRNSFGSAVLNNGQVMILGGERTNISGSIASVVGTATTPITVTMANPLPTDLTSGNINISKVAGFSYVNQSFDFTVTGPKTFTLNGTTGTVGSATPNTGTISVGETNTGEIFTPPTTAGGTGTWQNMTSFPLPEFGDGNIEVMNNGTVLAGYFGAFSDPDTGQTYRYNEALDPLVTPSAPKNSDPWSLDATLPVGDSNSEVTWNKLPDGSILSANIGPHNDESLQTATRFVPGATQAQDQWVSAGAIPVPLGATGGLDEIQEMGPAVLLPNGELFQIGSSGNTALYSPPALAGNGTGTWVAGPVVPGGYAPTDAPAAMMSNGDVLFAAAPYLQNGTGDGGYNNSTELFEYNPTTNIIRQVPPDNSSGTAIADLTSTLASYYCFEMHMLDLSNGQVMFSDGSGNAYVYTPNSSPNGIATPLAAWQPTISNITPLPFTSDFLLSGTQLNGISEGASYGDDAQMASNYPLVRLQSSSGAISYATSFSWSSDGVATGATSQTAGFALPTGDAPGAYLVSVVANGIASNSALVVFMGGVSSVSVVTDPNNSAEVDVDLAGKSAQVFTLPSTTSQVIVVGSEDSQSITINANLGSRNVTVNTDEVTPSNTETVDIQQTGTGSTLLMGGAGSDTYDIGGTMQNLNAIAGEVVLLPGTGSTNVTADDTYNGGTSTYTVLDGAVERTGFGGLFIEGNYQSLSLIAGYAPENVNVFETPAGSTLNLNGGGGDDTVDIGSGAGLGDIQGPIDVSNTPYYSQITLNDAGDTTAHPNVSINNGSIVGLAPAEIDYTTVTNDVNSLTIDGNSANDTYNINGGSTLTPVTINPGAGTNQVNFESNLSGTFTVNGAGSNTTVAVTDSASTPQTYTVTSTGLTVAGFTLSFSSINSMTLTAGSAMNNVVNINGTAAGTPLTINAGPGSSAINVSTTNATGPVTINGGSGNNTIQLSTPTLTTNLSGIAGAVSINAGTGSTNVYAYDDEMGSTATYSVSDGEILRAGFGGLFIKGSYQSLYLTVGYVPENVNVNQTPQGSTLNLNGAGGDDTVDIGATGNGLSEIQGPINVSNSAYYTQLTLNDAGDTGSHAAVSVTNGSVTGLSPAAINWTINDPAGVDVNSVTIDGNSASDTYNIVGGNSATPVTINTGAGVDQVNFESSLSGAFTVHGAGSNITVSVTDGSSTAQTYTVTSAGLTASGFTFGVTSIGLLILHPSGAANNLVDIESLPCVFDSDGSAGSANYVVSNAGVMPSLAYGMLLEGGSQGGTLTFNDSLGTDTSEPVVASSSVTAGGSVCGYLDISSITLDTGADAGIPVDINSTAAGTPVTVNAGPGATIIDANQTSPTGPVIIGPGAGFTTVNVSTTGLGAATVKFQATQQIVALTIGTVGMAVIAGSSPITLTTDALTIAAAATLDITNSTLAIDFTSGSDPITTIQGYIESGYKNDTWTGHGIVSSNAAADPGLYAVGYVDGNLDAGTPAAANQILIKNTLAGDANLDGVVNFPDLLLVAQDYGKTGQDWAHGDFNYDGIVNFPDLLRVAQNYGRQLAAAQSTELPGSFSASTPSSAVPSSPTQATEPAPNSATTGAAVATATKSAPSLTPSTASPISAASSNMDVMVPAPPAPAPIPTPSAAKLPAAVPPPRLPLKATDLPPSPPTSSLPVAVVASTGSLVAGTITVRANKPQNAQTAPATTALSVGNASPASNAKVRCTNTGPFAPEPPALPHNSITEDAIVGVWNAGSFGEDSLFSDTWS